MRGEDASAEAWPCPAAQGRLGSAPRAGLPCAGTSPDPTSTPPVLGAPDSGLTGQQRLPQEVDVQPEAQQQHKLGRELTLPVVHGTRPGAGACEEGSLRWLGWSWPRGAVPAAPSATRQGSWCPGAVLARAPAPSQPCKYEDFSPSVRAAGGDPPRSHVPSQHRNLRVEPEDSSCVERSLTQGVEPPSQLTACYLSESSTCEKCNFSDRSTIILEIRLNVTQ